MGRLLLKLEVKRYGSVKAVEKKEILLAASYKKFVKRTNKRFEHLKDKDYYGETHDKNDCVGMCDGGILHKKVSKELFLTKFYEKYKNDLTKYFSYLIKQEEGFEKLRAHEDNVQGNEVEANDLEF